MVRGRAPPAAGAGRKRAALPNRGGGASGGLPHAPGGTLRGCESGGRPPASSAGGSRPSSLPMILGKPAKRSRRPWPPAGPQGAPPARGRVPRRRGRQPPGRDLRGADQARRPRARFRPDQLPRPEDFSRPGLAPLTISPKLGGHRRLGRRRRHVAYLAAHCPMHRLSKDLREPVLDAGAQGIPRQVPRKRLPPVHRPGRRPSARAPGIHTPPEELRPALKRYRASKGDQSPAS